MDGTTLPAGAKIMRVIERRKLGEEDGSMTRKNGHAKLKCRGPKANSSLWQQARHTRWKPNLLCRTGSAHQHSSIHLQLLSNGGADPQGEHVIE